MRLLLLILGLVPRIPRSIGACQGTLPVVSCRCRGVVKFFCLDGAGIGGGMEREVIATGRRDGVLVLVLLRRQRTEIKLSVPQLPAVNDTCIPEVDGVMKPSPLADIDTAVVSLCVF